MPLALSIQKDVRAAAALTPPLNYRDVRAVPGHREMVISRKSRHNCCELIGSVEISGGIMVNVFQVPMV